jgi:HD-GYP domain-containing protein (c-di-GMP phosphodiesterase class II)
MNLIIRTLSFLGKSGIEKSEKELYLHRLLPLSRELITEIPYQFHTEVMNSVCAEWYTVIEPYLLTAQDKIQFLLQLIIRRQPITYIHSMMVSEIASLLADEVLMKCPEEFIGVLGYKTAKDVLKNRSELIEYIRSGGMLHDVGKCYITDIVNKQNRTLSPSEFNMILLHPKFGQAIAHKDSVLEPYYDVILGHHKFYDGKGGYPEDFDNTASPARFVIDLISIADSIDAATDVLGRNYAEGKNFETLFTELQVGAGTRYNPRIVKLIENNRYLKAALTTLTRDGRAGIYYQAYKDILQ